MSIPLIPPKLKTFPIEDRLASCRKLADLTRESFDGPLPEGRRGERMILAVWGRSVGSFVAVMMLGEQAYRDQVGMIARALFEGMIDAYWITKNPVEAQRLATLRFRQSRLVTAENWNDHERRGGDPALPVCAEDIRDREMLAKLFGSTGHRHWTRQALPERIAEVDATVRRIATVSCGPATGTTTSWRTYSCMARLRHQ